MALKGYPFNFSHKRVTSNFILSHREHREHRDINNSFATEDTENTEKMIDKKTVFILGAGASCPYGYPSGAQLREEICSSYLNDSAEYYNSQIEAEKESFSVVGINKVREFVKIFDKSSTESIDLFLARNPEFEQDGKLSIIFRIFAAEYTSLFREKMKERKKDWYSYLFQKLTNNLVKKDDYKCLCENDVSFITFNYDRSLEHFLYESLLNSFNDIGQANIMGQLNKLKIIHIFGQTAGLDWQNTPIRIEYKTKISCADVRVGELVKNLRTIYEERENPELDEAKSLIQEAEQIFFLGFGYAPENMEVLGLPELIHPRCKVYGTAFNMIPEEKKRVYTKLHSRSNRDNRVYLSPDATQIDNLDCLMLLENT